LTLAVLAASNIALVITFGLPTQKWYSGHPTHAIHVRFDGGALCHVCCSASL
jgi:hypothetical protein